MVDPQDEISNAKETQMNKNRFMPTTMFASRCAGCSATITKGSSAWFNPEGAKGQKMRCPTCGPTGGAKAPANAPVDPVQMTPAQALRAETNGQITAAAVAGAWGRESDATATTPRVSRNAGGEMRIRFDSVEHVVACAKHGPCRNPANTDMIDVHNGDHEDRAFFNGVGMSNVEARIREPMAVIKAELLRLVGKHAAEASTVERPMRRRRRGLDDGDEIDADRFLARIPEMWEKVQREPMPARVVKVAVNLTLSSGYGWETMIYRGAAALILAETLAARGIAVEIVGIRSVNGLTDKNEGYVAEFVVKPAGEYLNLHDLITVLCDPGFTRAVGMNAAAKCAIGKVSGGWGSPRTTIAGLIEADYLIDYAIKSYPAMDAWVSEQIAALDAPVVDLAGV